ncbi:MAG: fibronectin type III domain-containing protein [Spirochaetaceae bacterium]|nr:fibronectin type III domain-containing protein [Spirochaetaceae bacterium]
MPIISIYDYGVVLRGFTRDSAGVYHFSPRLPGYSANNIPELNVYIYNFAGNATGPLTVEITGPFNSSAASTGVSTINSIASDGSNNTLVVRPNADLPEGVHTSTVRVRGGNGINVSFPVRFVVMPDAPATFPGIPLYVTAVPGIGSITLSWETPASDGGAVITEYQVSSDDGARWVDLPYPAYTYTFTNLIDGTQYTFRVRAVNVIGYGLHASAAATTPTVPGAPQNFTAATGNTRIPLTWAAPLDNGGSTITGYEVSRDSGVNWISPNPVTATTHTFTDLTNGTPYTFWVRAVNAVGSGPEVTATRTPAVSIL